MNNAIIISNFITQAEIHRRSRNYLDHRKSLVEAMTRFPLAVQESEKHLDLLLLERCPNDLHALPDMGASLSTPSGAGSKRKKKKKKDKGKGGDGGKPKKRRKKDKGGLGNSMAAPSPGFCTPVTPVYGTPGIPPSGRPYPMVGASPSPAPGFAAGMPFTTPVTGSFHPAASQQVYAAQERAMQNAMAHLAAASRGGGPMLPLMQAATLI